MYRLSLGGSVNDTVGVCIALPLRWVNEARLKFCASGRRAGELRLEQVEQVEQVDQALAPDFVTFELIVGNH